MVRRATMVSQSPSVIRQWIEGTTNPAGAEPRWQVLPRPTRVRAQLAAQEWLRDG
jgi:hypothetical protein